MFRVYSKGCEYGIRALSALTELDCKDGFSIETVCRRTRLPVWFTRKVFQKLVRQNVLFAKCGPGGGYYFKKNPEDISFLDLIQAVDGNVFQKCILGKAKCRRSQSCPIHSTWEKIKKVLMSELRSVSVKQLMESRNHVLHVS